ncbi:MAG: hypothetical protein AB7W59_01365 [Acidimicrobiia bacterium]
MRAADPLRTASMTLRALARRRFTMAILVLMPLALYAASHDAVGRSVRALVFGISWAVGTVSFFATNSALRIEPRLRLAGRSRLFLAGCRIGALSAAALGLAGGFWILVRMDQPVRNIAGVGLGFVVTALVSVALGTVVGVVVRGELEGTLVLFFLAGLQAVTDPAETVAVLLPFWSSRELATYAVDGAAAASLGAGLAHAATVLALSGLVIAAAGRWAARPAVRMRS